MKSESNKSPIWPVAWSDPPEQMMAAARQMIACDALAVGLTHGKHPQPNEVMLAEGWPDGLLLRWLDTEATDDKTLFAAQRNGLACDESGSSALCNGGNLLIATQNETIPEVAGWWLVMQRKGEPFLPVEQRMAELMIRCWRSQFSCAPGSADSRIVIGHDRSILHTDPCTTVLFAQQPTLQQELIESFLPTARQRWNSIDDQKERDIAIHLDTEVQWIRFRKFNPLGREDAVHWRLDLTPLEENELPAVGVIQDERIARALAYIHDHFHQSPNLGDIARAVHLSPFHFHRIFSKFVGVSPKQYLQSKQLQTARWLLRSTSRAIGNVAESTGFASHGHFTSTFHRVVGVSPSEYREKRE